MLNRRRVSGANPESFAGEERRRIAGESDPERNLHQENPEPEPESGKVPNRGVEGGHREEDDLREQPGQGGKQGDIHQDHNH